MLARGTSAAVPHGKGGTPGRRKLTLLLLIAATYFMVAGGPYGLEDLVRDSGYLLALVALLVTPLLWSLPTAFMVSELSSAVPEEGGYYAWVRRGLGPFWGFQEAWLSLAASVFDMAIYPTLFVKYLSGLCQYPALANGLSGWSIGLAVIVVCVLLNVSGSRIVGDSSVLMTAALLGPFVVLTVLAVAHPAGAVDAPAAPGEPQPMHWEFVAGIFVAMWNYMGWDNASTIAGEVDRPQRTYPLAMLGAVALVTLTYVVPVWAASRTGIAPEQWQEGSWVKVAATVGGPLLAAAVALGGMISALGMFNALVLSYSRVPLALAEDGYLPGIFRRCLPRTGAPWVSIVVCSAAWALALQLSLKRLFALDVILYGASLVLEFAALVALRVREPQLPRPFRVPGGLLGAVLLGVGPTLLIGLAICDQASQWKIDEGEQISPGVALLLAVGLALLGLPVYWLSRWLRQSGRPLV